MRSAPYVPERSVRLYRGEYAAHAHDHAQVLVGLRGTLTLELDGHGSFVDASCALVIPAGTSHAYLAEAPASVLVVDCAPGRSTDRVRRFAPPPGWKLGCELPTAEGVL
jgi:uncharacterized protein YjlB